jgi:hypothetical protein
MRRQLRILQRKTMGKHHSAGASRFLLLVLWGFWRERQHVPMPFGGAPFSTGRPFLLSVHVLDETMRGTSAAKCQQPLDRRGQLFRVTCLYGFIRTVHSWSELISDLSANSWSG